MSGGRIFWQPAARLLFLLAACSSIGLRHARPLMEIGQGRSLEEAPLSPGEGPVRLRIVHINDPHARFEAEDKSFSPCNDEALCFGGFPKLTTLVKEERAAAEAAGEDILVLHAGDMFTGTTWDYVFTRQNEQIAPLFLNPLGLDAFTVGNHELDYGPAVLASFIGNLTAPVLSCNMDASREPLLDGLLHRYTIVTLPRSGARIAIVGLTTSSTAQSSKGGPTIEFGDELESLSGCVAEARAEGADIVIALTHVGAGDDLELAASPEVHDVDLIIGAHSHTLFYGLGAPADQPQTPGQPPDLLVTPQTAANEDPLGPYPMNVANGNKTIPVVSAFWGSRYVGVMRTEWSASGDLLSLQGGPMLLGGANSTNPVADDPEATALLDSLRGPITELSNQTVGYTDVYLAGPLGEPGTPDANLYYPVRMQETNLGDLVAEAFVWYYKSLPGGKASEGTPVVGMPNGGGIRTSIPEGEVKQNDVISVSPFGNWLVVKEVDTPTLIAALNNGLSTWSTTGPGGRFPQVSGLRYTFNSSAQAQSRLLGAWLSDGAPLEEYEGKITIILDNYMGLQGGDGYSMLADAPLILDTSYPIDRVLADYISAHSPIHIEADGRIVNCGLNPDNPAC